MHKVERGERESDLLIAQQLPYNGGCSMFVRRSIYITTIIAMVCISGLSAGMIAADLYEVYPLNFIEKAGMYTSLFSSIVGFGYALDKLNLSVPLVEARVVGPILSPV